MNNEIKFVAHSNIEFIPSEEVLRTEKRAYSVRRDSIGAGWRAEYDNLRNGQRWQSQKRLVGTHYVLIRGVQSGYEYLPLVEGRLPSDWLKSDFKPTTAAQLFPTREAAVAAIHAHAAKKR